MTLTLDLHFTRDQLLSANDRAHHQAKGRLVRAMRAAAADAKKFHAPEVHLERCECRVLVTRPNRQPSDVANWHPSIKAMVDGICTGPTTDRWEHALLPDDDDAHLLGPFVDADLDQVTGDKSYRFRFTFEAPRPHLVVLGACHDTNEVLVDLTTREADVLRRVAAAVNAAALSDCEPTIPTITENQNHPGWPYAADRAADREAATTTAQEES